ncbi:MAG: 4-(cytidine 5'-diphospho)-2-C-methyl-D-erythritol kinase [Lachnospiraceae bacterium]|nr:4-(cytidine 5'-diphospho)-2-C-methyl-D-erythritol kinase [Lachnospiraceae bacterium]MBR6256492.1 4-(cytidine 5'-diphospho)-2-C-methyl-D-erythritol kinase [Lachnospiraceae bacterium]
MEEVSVKAYAKINLTLDITGRREDGYHLLRSIMQQISVFDTVELKKADKISLELIADGGSGCSHEVVPADGRNIAWKAAELILKEAGISSGVEIILHKNIPAAAGLAGGSTDAAAVLKGINKLYGLGYDADKLCALGVRLGADVPFCIKGGTAMAEGIGDKLGILPAPDKAEILLFKLPMEVSTKEVYQAYDALEVTQREDKSGRLEELLKNGSAGPAAVASCLMNVLAEVTEVQHPVIKDIRTDMLEQGAVGALMSGSGPSVFGIFTDGNKAQEALENMKKSYPDAFGTVCSFVNGGEE